MLPAQSAAGPKSGQKQMAAHTIPGPDAIRTGRKRGRDARTRTQAHKRGRIAQARIMGRRENAHHIRVTFKRSALYVTTLFWPDKATTLFRSGMITTLFWLFCRKGGTMAHKIKTIGTGKNMVSYRLADMGEGNDSHIMTNAKRIMKERIRLLSDNQLSPVSDELKSYYIGKHVYFCLEPEEIDTYIGWKQKGYHVMKGQKAITFLELTCGRSWKKYNFFAASQVAR